jgi:hypothetical protein
MFYLLKMATKAGCRAGGPCRETANQNLTPNAEMPSLSAPSTEVLAHAWP